MRASYTSSSAPRWRAVLVALGLAFGAGCESCDVGGDAPYPDGGVDACGGRVVDVVDDDGKGVGHRDGGGAGDGSDDAVDGGDGDGDVDGDGAPDGGDVDGAGDGAGDGGDGDDDVGLDGGDDRDDGDEEGDDGGNGGDDGDDGGGDGDDDLDGGGDGDDGFDAGGGAFDGGGALDAGASTSCTAAACDVWIEVDWSSAYGPQSPSFRFSDTPGWGAAQWAAANATWPEAWDRWNNLAVVNDPIGRSVEIEGGEAMRLMLGLDELASYERAEVRVEGRSRATSSSVYFDVYNPLVDCGVSTTTSQDWTVHVLDLDLADCMVVGAGVQAVRVEPTSGTLAMVRMRLTLYGATW